jgi:hypothetical protein
MLGEDSSLQTIKDKFLHQTRRVTTDANAQVSLLGIPDNITDDNVVGENEAINNHSYTYLTDDPLSRIVNYDIDNHPPLFVCMYTQHYDLTLPYIKYYLVQRGNYLMFPEASNISNPNTHEGVELNEQGKSMETENTELPKENEELPEENTDIINESQPVLLPELKLVNPGNTQVPENEDFFYEQCSQYIKKYMETDDELSVECYKGYVEHDGNIYLFVDVTDTHFNGEFDNVLVPCIIDEIINTKRVDELLIGEPITELFVKNAVLTYFYNDATNKPLGYPICVYVCENIDDTNTYKNSKLAEQSSISMVTNHIHHPVVGRTYLFTTVTLNSYETPVVKRYTLFHQDATYVLHEPFIKTEYELIVDNECVCFLSDGIEYWSVKNVSLFSEI